jgi:hypothetical protein
VKTVVVTASHSYRPKRGVIIDYRAGQTYQRVPEAAARSIIEAGAGYVPGAERSEDDQPLP